MTHKPFPLTAALVAALTLAVPLTSAAQTADPDAPRTDRTRLFKAGGLGCVSGSALALLTGKRDRALAACAAGAAVGATTSYVQQQRELADETAQAARAAGIQAEVVTTETTVDGEKQPVLESLPLVYDPADMKRMDAATQNFFDKLAALLSKSSNGLTVRFEGRDAVACQVPIVELAKRGALAKVTVDDRCGSGDHRIVVTPVPDVR